MKLSNETRARLVAVNLGLWAICAVLALAVLGGPHGIVRSHLQPIGRELGGWGGLVQAAIGFSNDAIPVYEIAIDPKVMGAVQLLPADPTSESGEDSHWFAARLRTGGAIRPVWLQLVAPSAMQNPEGQGWRVRFDDNDRPNPMGEITLSPRAAGTHAHEAAIRDTARELGLLAPPHGFASVRINGNDAGIHFWSQGDGTAMLAQLGYPAGDVLQPDRDRVRLTGTFGPEADSYSVASATPDRNEIAPADGQLDRLFELTDRASDEDFDRHVRQLLDVEKYLRWNALAWMLGAPVIDPVDELAWYLDPVSGLLEPIVQDWAPATATAWPNADRMRDTSRLTARLLREPSRRAERNELLWSWATQGDEDVIADSERRLGESLTKLARTDLSPSRVWELYEDAEFRRESREAFRERKSRIRRALREAGVRARTAPPAAGASTTLAVELEPRGLAEIQLAELRLELDRAVAHAPGPATLRLIDPAGFEQRSAQVVPDVAGSAVRLRPAHFGVIAASDGDARALAPWRLEIDLPFLEDGIQGRDSELLLLELAFRNAVTGEALPTARLVPGEGTAREHAGRSGGDAVDVARPVRDVIRESGLPLEIEGDALVLRAGSYDLMQTLVVPPDFRLEIHAGVSVRLAPDVSIVSFRGITARGTQLEPIEFRAADPARPWGVIGVARAPEPSLLEFVSISGGSMLRFAGLEFEGQLSFNAADFALYDSEISDAHSGDGLSAKRSSFSIQRTRFAGNADDGVESEWSEGSVVGSVFLDNGDDGLDLSDSRLRVGQCDFAGMGDKPIHADARSVLTVSEIRILNPGTTTASKIGTHADGG